MRSVHLPGLRVPFILGRDFISKVGVVVGIAMGMISGGPVFTAKAVRPAAAFIEVAVWLRRRHVPRAAGSEMLRRIR